jgi:hypothetical protein
MTIGSRDSLTTLSALGATTALLIMCFTAQDTEATLWELPAAAACDSHCTNCQGGGHATIEGQANKGLHEQPLSCDHPGTCSSHGHDCEGPPPGGGDGAQMAYDDVIAAVLDAARVRDLAGVFALVERFPSYLRRVPEREAIQAIDCQGHVVLHMPYAE